MKFLRDRLIGLAGILAWVLFLAAPALLISRLMSSDQSPDILGQPRIERATQQRLPHSQDPIWAVLGRTKVREDTARGLFTATYPAAVTALAGQTLSIAGFMLPLESKSQTQHFLLSRNTPVCPFCPPGEPNEMVEVFSRSPILPTNDEISVTGRFMVQKDSGGGMLFRLDGAEMD